MLNNELKKLFVDFDVKCDEPLNKYTNTKTGGPAEVLAFPKDIQTIENLVKITNENRIPLTILGNASNLIVRDGGIDGLVIILQELNEIQVQENKVIAQSGASLIKTTRIAAENELTGFEFASGIPGSIGGAVFMNAGAYGGEIKNVLESVGVLTQSGEYKRYQVDELELGYRHSRLQDEHDIVIDATFTLKKGNKDEIHQEMQRLSFLRASKQPLEYPSCGSVFKRPEGHFTGKLIHDAGLQGFQIGGAQVSKKHAGFIVNIDHATASDYVAVIKHIQKEIKAKFDVQLETEVRIIGHD